MTLGQFCLVWCNMVRGKNVYRPRRVFQVCLELSKSVEKKRRGRRKGRPPTYPDHLYIAFLLLRAYFGWTYRETEAFVRDLFPELPCPSFQALHWYAKVKLKEDELLGLLELLKERLSSLLQDEGLLILDTTGIPQRGKTQELKWMRGRFRRVVRGHVRLCLAIRYLPSLGLLLPVGMSVGAGYAPDAFLGARTLRQVEPGGVLLADAGFDAASVFQEARGKFIPMIRLKEGGEVKDPRRKEVQKAFSTELYRLRAVGEGVFGAIKTRLNGLLRNLKPEQAQKEALLLVICYLLRILLALLRFFISPCCLQVLRPLPLFVICFLFC